MKRSILIFLSCIALPVYAADFSAYVPKGWKIIKSVKGDLNGDNQADAVLVLQKQDKANIIPNDSMGLPDLDTNPRMLKVLFKQAGGYKTAVENTTLIPPEDSKDNGCLGDPFSDLSIDKGRLKLRFEWFYSCGSWWMGDSNYLFRYQNDRFLLIGYSHYEHNRASGEINEYSDNYLTGKRKRTTGGNVFTWSEDRPKVKWERLKKKPYYLDEPYQYPTD